MEAHHVLRKGTSREVATGNVAEKGIRMDNLHLRVQRRSRVYSWAGRLARRSRLSIEKCERQKQLVVRCAADRRVMLLQLLLLRKSPGGAEVYFDV